MIILRNKVYLIISTGCLAGYVWLYFVSTSSQPKPSFEACLIKQITNIPCPSCGSTRAVISLLKGNFSNALLINPLGYAVAAIIFLSPLWIAYDVINKRKTFISFFEKFEAFIKKPQFAIPLILLVMLNWIWNITKGL